MTALVERLREQIRREGPLTFLAWMRAALYDESDGYYRRHARRWGRAGDYRTSPERSALFAATFARYFASLYVELGRPSEFFIIEAGGGAGHFARGVLQTLKRDAPDPYKSLHYIFDETSADARARAAALLSPVAERVKFRSLGETTGQFEKGVVFSNELLDALPVHRVVRRGGELRELYVGVNEDGRFEWIEDTPSTPRLTARFEQSAVTLADGHIAEVHLEAEAWIRGAARALGEGFVVTVDYGDDEASLYADPRRREGTLRAFSRHDFAADFLQRPGEVDLTTTINWTRLLEAGERSGLRAARLERQDKFLLRAGLLEQLERETELAADEAEIMRLRLDAREMILPGGMSEHFHVLTQKKDAS